MSSENTTPTAPITCADPDRACAHEDFAATVDVGRITEDDGVTVKAYMTEIAVACADCGERFRWRGVPAGLNFGHPTVTADEFTLNAPIRPASADPDFGLGLPGYAIGYREERTS